MVPPDAEARRRGDAAREEPEFLVVGRITKPHGIKGEVSVFPLTDRPEETFAPGSELILGDAEGKVEEDSPILVIERVRPYKRGFLVSFEDHPDRASVEPYAQRYLAVPIEALEPLEEGEVYYHQLLGLEVVTTEGEVVGRVREVYDTEPAHLLDVKGPEKSYLIPFVERIVKKVDLDAGQVVIEPPPGLLEI